MACVDEGVMSLEAAYLGALARVTAAERVGDELVLAGGGVELRLAAVPVVPDAELEGTTWVLESLIAGDTVSSTVAGSRATLTIAGGTGSGSTGCNTFNGPMEPGEDVITSGDLATTRMACDGLMEQEEAVLAVLGASPAHVIEGDTLTLTLEDGRALVYRAEG
jgi:heat shock protein HslJ